LGKGKAGFHSSVNAFFSPKQVNSWMSDHHVDPPAQSPNCPECGSTEAWKDGLRYNGNAVIQRWLCRDCGYRFSPPSQPELNNKKENRHTLGYQVCVADGATKNLDIVETRIEKRLAGATTSKADLKGKIIEYLWWMKKQGYAEDTINLNGELIEVLAKRGANLYDPESVKDVIAKQDTWGESRKNNAVKAYTLFLTMLGLTWEKPRYKATRTLPFIPTETEIDDLIAQCSKQMATFLQTAKETAARRGEVFNLKWTDIDLVTNTIRITAEKGSNPRIFRLSTKLAQMLGSLQRTPDSLKVWVYKDKYYLDKQFRRQRKRVTHKLGNPRILQIHFHTLRHWKATMLYHQTKDILYVMQFLGHRKIENTLFYIQLAQALFQNMTDEYTCKVAKNLKEATELIEAGFQYVTEMDGCKLFKKLKTSFLGSSSREMGSSASLV